MTAVLNLPESVRLDTPVPSLATKLFFGIGSIAYGIKDSGFQYLLLIYYNQVLGLPERDVGFAIMLALIVDAVIDPLIGTISDNFRS